MIDQIIFFLPDTAWCTNKHTQRVAAVLESCHTLFRFLAGVAPGYLCVYKQCAEGLGEGLEGVEVIVYRLWSTKETALTSKDGRRRGGYTCLRFQRQSTGTVTLSALCISFSALLSPSPLGEYWVWEHLLLLVFPRNLQREGTFLKKSRLDMWVYNIKLIYWKVKKASKGSCATCILKSFLTCEFSDFLKPF